MGPASARLSLDGQAGTRGARRPARRNIDSKTMILSLAPLGEPGRTNGRLGRRGTEFFRPRQNIRARANGTRPPAGQQASRWARLIDNERWRQKWLPLLALVRLDPNRCCGLVGGGRLGLVLVCGQETVASAPAPARRAKWKS
jgi:hypothetical protein